MDDQVEMDHGSWGRWQEGFERESQDKDKVITRLFGIPTNSGQRTGRIGLVPRNLQQTGPNKGNPITDSVHASSNRHSQEEPDAASILLLLLSSRRRASGRRIQIVRNGWTAKKGVLDGVY